MKKMFAWFHLLRLGGILLLVLACTPAPPAEGPRTATMATGPLPDVVVSGRQWGQSTCFIGATEGSSNFSLSDLRDLGINAYHIYGGMSRWEAQDDSRVYGLPTIDQIKAHPESINWNWWDHIMTDPPGGSDYWWTYQSPAWHGNARTLFSSLKSAGIRPVLTLRNRDNLNNPAWSPDPPITQADWNEWWEHVFATVYWLNVRNDYAVNDFEVQNEPDLANQGWAGTEEQYLTFLQYTRDAISYVYKTYLPGRAYHIYAPATTTGSVWPHTLLQQAPDAFDGLDIHDYSSDIRKDVQQAHSWLSEAGREIEPVWLSEWGSYQRNNKYDTVAMGLSLLNNLIYGSEPGDTYVYGSAVFSLYDYGTVPFGLIRNDGTRRADYYAVRMATRALQGCRPTYQSVIVHPDVLTITTRDAHGNLFFLLTNRASQPFASMTVDLSALTSTGNETIWQFDARHNDQVVGTTTVKNGRMTLAVPAEGALLVEIARMT